MTNTALETARIGLRLTAKKTELISPRKPAPQAKAKLRRFPPIDRVLGEIVENSQFKRT